MRVDLSLPRAARREHRQPVAPSVNALDNTVVVAFFGMKKKDITLSVPTGMTGLYNYQNPQDVTIRAATQPWTTAGPTGSRTLISSPKNYDKWVAQLVVLRGFATVTNTAPVYTKPANQTADEGENKAFTPGQLRRSGCGRAVGHHG